LSLAFSSIASSSSSGSGWRLDPARHQHLHPHHQRQAAGGNLRVGKAYTALLDLKPGDEFESKLGRKQMRLVPLGGEEGEE
jgi:AbrB-like transcriptional regulator